MDTLLSKLGSVLLVVIPLALTLGFAEAALRVLNLPPIDDHSFGPQDPGWDRELGWALAANPNGTKRQNACGEEVNIAPYPSPYLLRRAKGATGPTLLFIGDSFTLANTVNSGSTFYDWVEKLLPFPTRVYAGGVGGYGNVQENLLIKKILATTGIHPDIIIWEICGNDISNNDFEIETHDPGNNNGIPRPYYDLTTKTITIRDPKITLRSYYLGPTLSHSRVAVLALLAAIKVDLSFGFGWFPKDFTSATISLPPERLGPAEKRGLAVTKVMVDDIAQLLPDTVLVGFGAGTKHDLIAPIFTGPRRLWLDVPTSPTFSCPPDPHWNALGHEQIGRFIAAHLLDLIHPEP